jgi:peptidoglycan/LPS O-acetylase OafA/YrhL
MGGYGTVEQIKLKDDRTYRPDIDGLRSIAILSVILFHSGVSGMSGGFTGVDIFFVISGYLIGGHIHAELVQGSFRYLSFYQRRAKRILPALYVILASVTVLGLILFSPFELRRLASTAFATAVSASNLLFWKNLNYFSPQADDNPLLMTWSLGVEEQFYLLIPLMMVLLSRLRQRLVLPLIGLIVALSFGLAWFQSTRYPVAAFYLLGSRAWELGAGVALAILESEGRKISSQNSTALANAVGFAGLVLTIVPFYALTSSTPFPGPAAVPSVFGSALLIASRDSWINRSLLSASPFVFIGRVSYSWYLWHWPVLTILRILYNGALPVSWGLASMAVAFGLAILTYYLVEQPFRASKLSAGPLLIRYAGVSFVILAVTGLIYWSGGLGIRYKALAATDDAQVEFHQDPCTALAGETTPHLAKFCTETATSAPKIALWGDSHAAALAPALRSQLAHQGYGMEEYAKTSCPPLIGAARYDPQHPAHVAECIAFNKAVLQRVVLEPDVKVVALQASWGATFSGIAIEQLVAEGHQALPRGDPKLSAEILENSLYKTIQSLRAAGKLVVVFGDAPRFDVDPIWRMRTSRIALRRKLAGALSPTPDSIDPGADHPANDTALTREIQQMMVRTALSFDGVTNWELRNQLCDTINACLYRQGDAPYYVDFSHLATQGGLKGLQGWSVPKQLVRSDGRPPSRGR